jgi:hypothetical protein
MATVNVPNASDVADDWTSGTQGAGNDFVEAAVAASNNWLDQASSDQAQQNYETAMQDPEVLSRRQSNTDQSAQSRYESSLNSFGAQRYQSGTQNAEQRFQNAIGEVLGAIDGLQIPDRGRALSQANQDRALQVQRALNEAGQQV